ncbi:hypothetical protein QUC31_008966 [Theobroma cacao]
MEPTIQRFRLIHVSIGKPNNRENSRNHPFSSVFLHGTWNSETQQRCWLLSVCRFLQRNQTLLQGIGELGGFKLGPLILWKIVRLNNASATRTVAASTPRKSENNDSEKGEFVSNDQTKPIVAFSKPPPQPPLLGPLVALSLLETWSRRDGDDS